MISRTNLQLPRDFSHLDLWHDICKTGPHKATPYLVAGLLPLQPLLVQKIKKIWLHYVRKNFQQASLEPCPPLDGGFEGLVLA